MINKIISKPKILFLAVNFDKWVCQTLYDEQAAIQNIMPSGVFYGPGYQYRSNYLPEIINDTFGCNIPDAIFCYIDERRLLGEPLSSEIVSRYNLKNGLEIFPTGLKETNILKIAWINDFWHCSQQEWDEILLGNVFDIAFTTYAPPFVSQDVFNFFFSKRVQGRVRFIPWPRSVNPKIFKDYGLPKKYDISLLGAMDPNFYPFRYRMHQTLSQLPDITYFHKPHPGYDFVTSATTLSGELYSKAINQSKIFASCTGKFKLPFIKLYEVLASRTVLLCDPPAGAVYLGLESGKNYINVSESNFLQVIKRLLNSPDELRMIATNASALFQARHTTNIRAQEFVETINGVLNGKKLDGWAALSESNKTDNGRFLYLFDGNAIMRHKNNQHRDTTRPESNEAIETSSCNIQDIARPADKTTLSIWMKYGLNNRPKETPPVVTDNPELIVLRGVYLRQLAEQINARYFAEIGTARGFQSFIWAQYLLDLGNNIDGKIYTCDINGMDLPIYKTPLSGDRIFTRRQLWDNTPHESMINFVHGTSDLLASHIRHSLDLIYIDGEHTEAAVLKDFLSLLPFMHPGSIIVFDDCDERFPGVQKAVTAITEKLGIKADIITFNPSTYKIAVMTIPSQFSLNGIAEENTSINEPTNINNEPNRSHDNCSNFNYWFKKICIPELVQRSQSYPIIWQDKPLTWEVCHEIYAFYEFCNKCYSIDKLLILSNHRYELLDKLWPGTPENKEILDQYYTDTAKILPWGHGVFQADHHVTERRDNWLRRVKLLLMLQSLGVKSLVDYGAGGGHTTLLACAMGFQKVVHHEYDVFHPYVRWRAKQIIDSAESMQQFVLSNAKEKMDLSFTVDAVICTDVAEHVFDPEQLLLEIQQALSPGGYLIWVSMFEQNINCHLNGHLKGTEEALLNRFGFERIRALPVSYQGHSGLYRLRKAVVTDNNLIVETTASGLIPHVIGKEGPGVLMQIGSITLNLIPGRYLDDEIINGHLFEEASVLKMASLIKPGMVIIDVGANFGYYTLLFSKWIGPSGKVIAFEPTQEYGKRLKEHLHRNKTENVTVVLKGLSRATEEMEINVGECSATLHWPFNMSPRMKEKISLVSLDEWWETYIDDGNPDQLDFIKVDTDGHEPHFLLGAVKTITRLRPIIHLEFFKPQYEEGGFSCTQVADWLEVDLEYTLCQEDGRTFENRDALLKKIENSDLSTNILCFPKRKSAENATNNESTVAAAFKSPEAIYLASADRMDLVLANIQSLKTLRHLEIDTYASVIGGLSGLNYLLDFAPTQIVLFDINPEMLRYAELVLELIRISTTPKELISRIFSRSVDNFLETAREPDLTLDNQNLYLAQPLQEQILFDTLSKLSTSAQITFKSTLSQYLSGQVIDGVRNCRRLLPCWPIDKRVPVGGGQAEGYNESGELEPNTNTFFYGHGWLGSISAYEHLKNLIQTIPIRLEVVDLMQTDLESVLDLSQNNAIHISNIDDWFMDGWKERMVIWESQINKALGRLVSISSHNGVSILQPDPHLRAYAAIKPHVTGKLVEVTHKTPWGFHEYDRINVTAEQYLSAEYPADTTILHILIGEGISRDIFSSIYKRALSISNKIIILEHNRLSLDWHKDECQHFITVEELRDLLGVESNGSPIKLVDFQNIGGIADDARNLLFVVKKSPDQIKKLKILLCYDEEGWAWWHRAHNIKRYISSNIDIDILKIGTPFNHLNYNLIVLFEAYLYDQLVNVPTEKILVGSSTQKTLDYAIDIYKQHNFAGFVVNNFMSYRNIAHLKNVYCCQNGVDAELFYFKFPRCTEITACWVGNNLSMNNKGLDLIQDACTKAGVKLLALDQSENVYKGSVFTHEQVRDQIYHQASCYICASEMEGTPNPALEALACGLPVISTRVGNMPEIIIDGFNGYLVDRSVISIVNALEKLKCAELRQLSANARQSIENGWTWKQQVTKYENMFVEISAEKASITAPLVSVIVPTHNRPDMLKDAIRSILEQTFQDFEIIVINDAGCDVLPLTNSFGSAKIVYLANDTNCGLAASRNRGVTASSGKYILFLDDDDKIHPLFLEETVAILNLHPDVGFVYTAVQHFGARTDIWSGGPFEPQRLLRENQLTCTSLFRRTMYDEIGGLKREMQHGFEDWEFWISGYELGWQGYLIDKPYFYYRKHPSPSMLGSIYEGEKKTDFLKAKIISLHPKLYTEPEVSWAQAILAQPDPFGEPAMGVETLKSRDEIRQAREEMGRRGIDFLAPAAKGEFQRNGWIDAIGDIVKSWDVLKTVAFIEKKLPKDSPVLDIGAYCSEVPCALAQLGYSGVSGIDLNPDLVKMPYNDRVRYHIGNFMETPFEDRSFFAITAISVIEHGFDSGKLLTEVSRLLKPGGYFIASVDYWPEKIETGGINCFGLDWRIFSEKEIIDFIEEAREYGLQPVGGMDFAALDRTIDWMDRRYTFAWLALKKADPTIVEASVPPDSIISRIFIAHTKFPFSPVGVNSGAEMATIHMARNLAASGIEVKVFGILNGPSGTHNGVEYLGFASYGELCHALATCDESADIVISNSVEALEHSSRNSRFGKRLLWVHAPANSFLPELETINRHADAIIHVSRHQMALAEKTGFAGPSILLYNGFDEKIFFPSSTYDPYQIIYAGALVPLKGVHLLVQAFPKIKAAFPEATLVICGSSAMWGESPYLDQERISRALPGIRFLGAVLQQELARLFATSALGVMPTIKRLWEDPFPLTPVEMQACGLPVLVSAAGGLPESLRDGFSEFVLDSESPDDWADAIISILRDQKRLAGMRRACVDHARERFRWQELASNFLGELRSLAAPAERPPIVSTNNRSDTIGFLSTFNQPCGIATHTGYVVGGLKQALEDAGTSARIVVLAEKTADKAGVDDATVYRCWRRDTDDFRKTLEIIKQERVTILHIQFQDGLFAGTDITGLVRACKAAGIKVFITFHSSEHSLPLCAELINMADRSFVHLDQSAIRFIALGASPDRIRKVPHGILEDLAPKISLSQAKAALGLPAELQVVSSFGFFDPYKGVLEIIQEFPSVLRHHNAAFIFLGGGHPSKPESLEYIRACRTMAENLGISDKIIFAEQFLPEKLVSNYLSASDAVVMNYLFTRNEISGAAAFALAHRRPIITSPVPAFRELTDCTLQLSQGMNLAQAINLVLDSPSLADHLTERTERYIAENSYRKLGNILIGEYGLGQRQIPLTMEEEPLSPHHSGEKNLLSYNIVWEGPQFIHHSLALVNRELCLNLLQNGHNISLKLLDDTGTARGDKRFAPLEARVGASLQCEPDVIVRHWYPPDLTPPEKGHWVMIQPWEMGSVPKRWIEAFNSQVDEVWVPSSYVRDCYIRSGMDAGRVAVVPNGIDTERFSPSTPPYPLKTTKPYRFLYVGNTTLERKGFDILITAFIHEFFGNTDVCLVVKDMAVYTGGANPLRDQIGEICRHPGAPEIVFLEQDLTSQELAGLYTACSCFVHSYRAEGFSLPIAEAMASGLPVIATGHGACLDFCDDSTTYLIPAREVTQPRKQVYGMETVDYPWWAEPDANALRSLMRRVYENPEEAGAKGRAARMRIEKSFTWQHSLEKLEERLKAITKRPIRRHATPPKPQQHTSCYMLPVPAPHRTYSLLFIAPILPTFDRDSGSFRLYQLLKLLKEEGHQITFIAQGGAGNFDPRPYQDALQDLGIEVVPYDPERLEERTGIRINAPCLNLEELLTKRRFDAAYIYFYFTAAFYYKWLRKFAPKTKIIVDSVDFHYLRERREAELAVDNGALRRAEETLRNELLIYELADLVIMVTENDRQALLEQSSKIRSAVIPNIHPPEDVPPPFSARNGLLFVGNFLHTPNVDAVLYLINNIMPLIRKRLPTITLSIAGNSPPPHIKALDGPYTRVLGYVEDLKPLLRSHRVSVAPLRFGAGMKGKVGEAMSAGIPVVASAVAAEGCSFRNGEDILIARNENEFADMVVTLHTNEHLWSTISQNGRKIIQERYTPETLRETIRGILSRTIADPLKGIRSSNRLKNILHKYLQQPEHI